MRKKMKLLAVLLTCFLLAGCSGTDSPNVNDPSMHHADANEGSHSKQLNSYGVANYKSGAEEVEDIALEEDVLADSPSDQVKETSQKDSSTEKEIKETKQEEKLVYTCDLQIETTDYAKTISAIDEQIKKYHGIIDSQNESDNAYNWYYSDYEKTEGTMEMNMTVRVPSKDYKNFLSSIEGNGKIKNKSMNVTNISQTYYDTKAVIESLEIQEKRLLQMMKDAKSIKDMLQVENRLTEVQTQLNQYNTQLSSMDTDVAYSTINLTIREVLEYKPTSPGHKTNTFIDRLKNTFRESKNAFLACLEYLLFTLIYFLPYLLILGIILFFALRSSRKRRNNKVRKIDSEKMHKIKEENDKFFKEHKE